MTEGTSAPAEAEPVNTTAAPEVANTTENPSSGADAAAPSTPSTPPESAAPGAAAPGATAANDVSTDHAFLVRLRQIAHSVDAEVVRGVEFPLIELKDFLAWAEAKL